MLERGEAICHGGTEHHFMLPSGHHAAEFIRVGDALHDPVEVARLADWVMPYLGPESTIIADTGSMNSLLIAIQALARDRYGLRVEIETLDGYPDSGEELDAAITELKFRRQPGIAHVILLVSVNSSGKLIRIFRSLARADDRVIVVCDAAHTPEFDEDDDVAIFSRHPVARWDANAAGRCEKCTDLDVIEIHRRTYERLPSDKRKLVKIAKTVAGRHRSFWEGVDKAQAVRLHVNRPYPSERTLSRHLAVYIDVARLLTQRDFHDRCIEKLRCMPCPDYVLIPKQDGSPEMADDGPSEIAKLVLEAFALGDSPLAPDRVHFVGHGTLPQLLCDALRDSRHVLIADDALVHGTTLIGLRDAIYAATQDNAEPPDVHAFVAVARPRDPAVLKTLMVRYQDSNGIQLEYGELLFLPGAYVADHECPWCAEMRKLQDLLAVPDPEAPTTMRTELSDDARAYVTQRLERLRGEMEPPILLSGELGGMAARASTLQTRKSFFGELHHLTAFAAGSSAAQEVRSGIEERRTQLPREVIDVKFLIDAYFESVILAPMLRTLSRRDMRWAGQEEQVADLLRRLDVTRAYPGIIAELGWAAINDKLPQRAVHELLCRATPDPAIEMLKAVLKSQIAI